MPGIACYRYLRCYYRSYKSACCFDFEAACLVEWYACHIADPAIALIDAYH
jgi:hypothetical protein